ncbi:DUF6932 family protein [Mycobacteroides chelonae]|uniref:DUF6932 family protein n=1 Tax=Mycobacteroides chelonae TaxID=1774 RepID=UPI0039E85BF0
MPLPEWTSDDPGVLPPGRHAATLDDLYMRCVLDAPERERREELFGAFRSFMNVTRRVFGSATVWVSGGLVTRALTPPFDLDVLLLPDNWSLLGGLNGHDRVSVYGLFSLEDVVVGDPLYIAMERIRPFAGEIDSFLCFPGQEDRWHDRLSSIKRHDQAVPGSVRGYVEVRT